MRFIHSRGITHRNLTPHNILLDLNWNIRICGFGHNVSPDQPTIWTVIKSKGMVSWPDVISRYTAPEMNDDITVQENDVFSFGMILYELIVGRPVFPKDLNSRKVALALIMNDWRLDIPNTVIPITKALIRDCLAMDYRNRPSFDDILERLKEIEFQLIAGVRSVRITEFVKAVEFWEYVYLILGPDETSKGTAFVNAGLFDERIQPLIPSFARIEGLMNLIMGE
jgi:serine/threonine protein kinase